MKKIFCLIAALLLIAGCDDGDMSYKTFDFSNQADPTACSANTDNNTSVEVYYKINNTEGLILTLPKGTLENTPTGTNAPQEITLGGANSLIYQNYVTKPASLCTEAEIPATTETWKGQGTLSVKTYENIKDDKLIGYIHVITVVNVSFKLEGSDETITLNNSLFGKVYYDFDFDFNFNPTTDTEPEVKQCPQGTLLYTRQGTEILSLDIADFDAVFTESTETKNIEITTANADEYTILFNVYSSSVNDENACAQGSDVPSLPIQKWQLISGTLVIIPTETGGTFKYDIYLKDATFGNLINTGDTFILDRVIDVEPNGYFFGTY